MGDSAPHSAQRLNLRVPRVTSISSGEPKQSPQVGIWIDLSLVGRLPDSLYGIHSNPNAEGSVLKKNGTLCVCYVDHGVIFIETHPGVWVYSS